MITLHEQFTKNGFSYKLMKRSAKKAIYAQYLDNLLVGYEVIKIRVHPPRYNHFLGRHEPESEIYPSNEEWGKWAWTERTIEEAYERFKLL